MFGVVAEAAKRLCWWHEHLTAGHCVGTFIDLHHLQREVRTNRTNIMIQNNLDHQKDFNDLMFAFSLKRHNGYWFLKVIVCLKQWEIFEKHQSSRCA